MRCRHCGTDIADKALICYRCGAATTEPRVKAPEEGSLFDHPRRGWRRPLLLVAAVVTALAVIAYLLLSRHAL